jgi:hypothetical protein
VNIGAAGFGKLTSKSARHSAALEEIQSRAASSRLTNRPEVRTILSRCFTISSR